MSFQCFCQPRQWVALPLCLLISFGMAAAAAPPEKVPTDEGLTAPDDATPDELLDFIQSLERRRARGVTRADRMAQLQRQKRAIVSAADRVMATDIDDAAASTAARAKLDALATLNRLGDSEAKKQLPAFLEELRSGDRPALAQEAEVFDLIGQLGELDPANAKLEDAKALLDRAVALIKKVEVDEQLASLAAELAVLVRDLGDATTASQALAELAPLYVRAKDLGVVSLGAQMTMAAGRQFEAGGDVEAAKNLYRQVADSLAASDVEQLKAISESFEADLIRLELIGKPLDLVGTLADGSELNWKDYRGKIVLVDFWATWCGPCLKVLPELKETYSKYHERGFDVLGISLDDDPDAVSKFISDEKIAWSNVIGDNPEASGFDHPMAKRYGVNAIPMTILVDRDGRVVALNTADEALDKLLDGLIEPEPARQGPAEK